MRCPPTFHALLALALAACSNLSPAEPGVCGNGAVDPGEDCDGASSDGTCGSAADVNACHFVCSDGATCPTGYACGALDARCRAPSGTFAATANTYSMAATSLHVGDVDGDGYGDLIGIESDRLVVRYSDANGDLAATSTQPIPESTGAVAYGDLDGDGRVDAIVPTSLGLVSFLGTAARDFSPYPYATIPLAESTDDLAITAVQRDGHFPLLSTLMLAYDSMYFAYQTGSGQVLHNGLRYSDSLYMTCLDGSVHFETEMAGEPDCAFDVGSGSGSGSAAGSAETFEDLLEQQVVTGKLGVEMPCTASMTSTTLSCNNGAAGTPTAPTPVPSATDATDEAVIAKTGAAQVLVLSASGVLDPATTDEIDATTSALRLLQTVTLAKSPYIGSDGSAALGTTEVAVDGRIGIADLNADGYNDLVIPSSYSSAGTVMSIAYNLGNGYVSASAAPVEPGAFVTTTGTTGQQLPIGAPRLWVDINGDGAADLVTNEQVFLTTCANGSCAVGSGSARYPWAGTAVATTTRAWTTAIAVDINHDGYPDIAGFVSGSTDVDIMLGTSSIYFNRFTVPTTGPVKQIATGDFDGDLVPDLAIVVGLDGTVDEADTLEVAFGATSGGPSPVVTMGTFGDILSIAPVNIAEDVTDLDTATDLVVVDDRNGTRGGAIVQGSSSRQLVAPYLAPDQAQIKLANFDGSAGLDVAAIGNDGTVSLFSGTGGGELADGATASFATIGNGCMPMSMTTTTSCPDGTEPGATITAGPTYTATGSCIPAGACSAPVRGNCTGTIAKSCTVVAPSCPTGMYPSEQNGCWDGYCLTETQCFLGGTDLTVSVAPLTPGSTLDSLIAIQSIEPGGGSAIGSGSCAMTDITVLTPPSAGSAGWTITGPTSIGPLSCQRAFQATSRDLDNDGAADLVFSLCPNAESCSYGASYVAWSRSGVIDTSDAMPLALTDSTLKCARFVPIQLDLDPDFELLSTCIDSVGAASVHVFDLDASHTFVETAAFPVAFASIGVVSTGDFNGDGLFDLAIQSGSASGELTAVYLQCAAGDPSCHAIPETTP